MINPGVIVLSRKKIGGTNAVIEDNIGESIHFHFGKLRLDLTVEDFLTITQIFVDTAKDLLGSISNELFEYDPIFLNYISEHLTDLDRIEDDEVLLNDIICVGKVSKNELGPVHLNKSLRYLALLGDKEMYEKVEREKPLFFSDMERLHAVHEFVKNTENIGNIVLINDTNIIYDGQHRAACLLYERGNIRVKVKRFYFKKFRLNYKIRPGYYYLLKKIRNRIIRILERR